MRDIFFALGAILLVEGILFTLFPGGMRKMMRQVITMPETTLRYLGLAAFVVGFFVIYATKH